MTSDRHRSNDVSALPSAPRITRRQALLGAAVLAAPLAPRLARADAVGAPAGGIVVLNGNENPYGPSPAARQAILASVGNAPRYADENIEQLRARIAARESVDPAQVTLGAGSGELLKLCGLLGRLERPPGELVAARPTYEELPHFAEALGLKLRWVAPDGRLRHDLAAMRGAVTADTRLVYVCNPNNPTGAAVTRTALASFVKSVPSHVLVVADEAYIDFVTEPDVATVVPLVKDAPNLVVLRTFSKIHGLAGLRIGYGISSPEIARRFGRLWLTWPNTTGIDAAIASHGDAAFLASTRDAILADRARVHATLDRLGLARAEAQGNFVFFDTGRPVKEFQERMLAQGIKVGRRFDGFDTWSRTTIGTSAEVDRFLAALPRALHG